ncbi:MAG: hypothetical protein [Microvirus sp.]|nr:MAG: hypothetical protein [Microvirus sp.]
MNLKRRHVNKRKSIRSFKRKAGKTQRKNINPPPMRGGYRL